MNVTWEVRSGIIYGTGEGFVKRVFEGFLKIAKFLQPRLSFGDLDNYFIGAAYGSGSAYCLAIGTPIANRCLYNCYKKVIVQYQPARLADADT